MEVVRVHVLGLFPMIVSLAVELFCKTIHEVPFFFSKQTSFEFCLWSNSATIDIDTGSEPSKE